MLGRRPGLLGEEMRDTSREVVRFGGKTLQNERKIPVETYLESSVKRLAVDGHLRSLKPRKTSVRSSSPIWA
jgi:hypothetical protein